MNIEERVREIVREEIAAAFAAHEHTNAHKRWMTVAETAVYLGTTEKAVRRRIARGRIPTRRQGRSVLVDRIALDREIEAR